MVAAATCEYHRRLRDPQIDWGRSPEWVWLLLLRHLDYSERSWLRLVDIVVVVVVASMVVEDDDDDENGDDCYYYYYCP